MIPILFDEDETGFETNGIGRLADAISCRVTEERNGIYELEMEYPVSGQHFGDIERYRLIYATHEDGKGPQPFEIYRISRPMNGRVSVYAHHVSYRLNKTVTVGGDVPAAPGACAAALDTLMTGAILPDGQEFGFTFETDVMTGASFQASVPRSVRSRLLGSEGSILDQYGGEYEWDKFTVRLWAERGHDRGVTIRYGKNLTDIKQEYNIENTVTGVIGFWQGEDAVVTGSIQYSKYATQFTRQRIVSVDFSQAFDTRPDVQDLNARARIYANEHGLPDVSIDVSFIDLSQTEEYKGILPLSHVQLGDTVTVQYEELGIDESARIVKVVYDVLSDRYESVTVGTLKKSYTQTINDSVAEGIASVSERMSSGIANATAWLTGSDGYVMAVKDEDGTWKELIFASSKDMEAPTTRILRINNNGLGFSTTGLNGPYRNAWTIDGNLIADFIHGGTLTLGGNGNGNGWLKMVDAGNNQIGKWDKDGISIGAGSISAGIVNTGELRDKNGYNYWNLDTGQFRLSSTAQFPTSAYFLTDDEYFQSGKTYYYRLETQTTVADPGGGTITETEVSYGEWPYYFMAPLIGRKVSDVSGGVASIMVGDEMEEVIVVERAFYETGYATLDKVLAASLSEGMTQEQIFNILTDNGKNQGVFMLQNGNLYINATYIKSGAIDASLITTGTMNAERLASGSSARLHDLTLGNDLLVTGKLKLERKWSEISSSTKEYEGITGKYEIGGNNYYFLSGLLVKRD